MNMLIIGGSDAGISAALRDRELKPSASVTVVVADAYPNFSICGLPFYLSDFMKRDDVAFKAENNRHDGLGPTGSSRPERPSTIPPEDTSPYGMSVSPGIG